jgi:hypothetical protein
MYGELILHIQLMKDKFPETDGRLCRYCEEPWTYIRSSGEGTRNLKKFFQLIDLMQHKLIKKVILYFVVLNVIPLKLILSKKIG